MQQKARWNLNIDIDVKVNINMQKRGQVSLQEIKRTGKKGELIPKITAASRLEGK